MNLTNCVYFDDCMNHLPSYPDKCFDWAIVDPPYGIDGNSHRNNKSRSKIAKTKDYPTDLWDQKMPEQEYFDQLFRVSKNQIIFGINYFTGKRHLKIGGGRIVWDKVNGANDFSDAEIAYCSSIESVRIIPFMWHGMNQGKSFVEGRIMQGNKELKENRIHPTQKPVELYKWILKTFVKPGQKILDTHVGSGSIRIASDLYGVDLTGFEVVEKHYKDQEDRWSVYKAQSKLF